MRSLPIGTIALLLLGQPAFAQQQRAAPAVAPRPMMAIRAGRLVDPDAGTAVPNQIILVQDAKISAVGGNVPIPAGAQVIDLMGLTVLPGLVEAHNHLTMTLVETVPLYGSQPVFSDRILDASPLQMMKAKGMWRVGTDGPFTPYRGSQAAFDRTVDRLKAAYRIGVRSVFSTDFDYYVPGMTRGDEVIDALMTWKAAGIPPKDILKAMTTYGYQVTQVEHERGPIKPGLAADMIAVTGDPLADIDTLRKVSFVMKDGKVFKQNGVATPTPLYK